MEGMTNISKEEKLEYTGERLIPLDERCSKQTKDYKEHLARYRFASRFVKNCKVLDAACGVGFGSYELLRNNAKYVVGIDISMEAIDYANTYYKKDRLKFLQMDATEMEFEKDTFDVVVSFETIEHLKDQAKFISEVKRVLKKDGFIIISSPNKVRSPGKENTNPFHVKELLREEFFGLLHDNFETVMKYGQCAIYWRSLIEKIKFNSLSLLFIPFRKEMRDYFYPFPLLFNINCMFYIAIGRIKKE